MYVKLCLEQRLRMLCFCGYSMDTKKIYCWKFYQNWFILSWDIKSWTWPINTLIKKNTRNFCKGWLGQFHFFKHFFSSCGPYLTTNGWKAMEILKKVKLTAPYCPVHPSDCLYNLSWVWMFKNVLQRDLLETTGGFLNHRCSGPMCYTE